MAPRGVMEGKKTKPGGHHLVINWLPPRPKLQSVAYSPVGDICSKRPISKRMLYFIGY